MDEDLKAFLRDWFFRREREKSVTEFWEEPILPQWLLDRITIWEPFRARAIEDAKIHWGMPGVIGFGMELFFPEKVEIVSFLHWRQAIYRLSFQFGFGMRMEGTDWEKYDQKLERVGFENGGWRIIEVLNDKTHHEMQRVFKNLKTYYAEKKANDA